MERLTVLAHESGLRLDHVLERLLPGMGLRGRRRLCELGLAKVNGRAASPSYKVREGDHVEAATAGADTPLESARLETGQISCRSLFPRDTAHVVTRKLHLAALYKPAFLHTESLAGKMDVSLQSLMAELLGHNLHARLMNRLDFSTSGITVAALTPEGERIYKKAQDEALTEKRYLALLEGNMPHPLYASQRLLLDNRARVLVEIADHPDIRRHTRIMPLAVLEAEPLRRALHLERLGWAGRLPRHVTLAGCIILKGARHQIRAHCSALGFPLLGDMRYEARFTPAQGSEEAFFLHHGRIYFPGLDAFALPPWLELLGKEVSEKAVSWLKKEYPSLSGQNFPAWENLS